MMRICRLLLICFIVSFNAPAWAFFTLSAPSSSTTGSYTVSWSPKDPSGILYEQKNGGSWSPISVNMGSKSSKHFSGKSDGVYTYKALFSLDFVGYITVGYPSVIVANKPSLPGAPTANPNPPTDGNYAIDWAASTGNLDYYELWEQQAGSSWVRVYQGLNLTHSIINNPPGAHLYKARACNTFNGVTGCSDYTADVSITVPNAVPLQPGPLAVWPGYPAPNQPYQLDWTAPAGPAVDNYELEEQRVGSGTWTTIATTPNVDHTVSGHATGDYQYRVRGCNAQGCGDYTAILNLDVDDDHDGDNVSDVYDAYPNDPLRWSQPVGSLEGELNVSPSGAATYHLPIPVTPGRGGLTPKLSLNYNSQGGNSLAGLGWSLSGLSAISRCPQNHAQDGVVAPINFTSTDRFCLDGQRLVSVNGTYGASGTEYRTELDGFSRIISYNTQGSGPEYFIVETVGGETMEYGVTSDARVEGVFTDPLKGDVKVWALNKVQDRLGNTMTFTYTEDTTTGEHVISSIDYGKHTAGSGLPHSTVTFYYVNRPDVKIGYRAGAKSTQSLRLDKIQTDAAEMRLSYNLDASTTVPSRLLEIEHCGVGVGARCYDPLTFDWMTPNADWTDTSSYNPPMDFVDEDGVSQGVHLHDLDGDGLTDIIRSRTDSNATRINTGSGWSSQSQWVLPVVEYDTGGISIEADAQTIGTWFADLNGDGRVDVVRSLLHTLFPGTSMVQYLYSSHVMLNTGNGWQENTNYSAYLGRPTGIRILDLNGDGLADLLSGTEGSLSALINTGSQWQVDNNYKPPQALANTDNQDYGVRLIDINGDGLPDFLYGHDGTERAYLNTGLGWSGDISSYRPPQSFTNDDHDDRGARLVDVNSDGLPDFLYGRKNDGGTNYLSAWLNTGEGWVSAGNYAPPQPFVKDESGSDPSEDRGVRFADVNNDGLVDLLHARDGSAKSCYLNTGNGWVLDPAMVPLHSFATESGRDKGVRLADINGDNQVDFLKARDGSTVDADTKDGYLYLMTGITNGLGNTTTIEYGSLAGADHYTVASSTVFPNPEVRFPQYTVKTVEVPNGLGGTLSTSYEYQGLKVHAHGLGQLGFETMTVTNDQSGVYNITEYSHTYPYIGAPIKVESFLSNGTLISRVESTFNHLQTQTPDVSERGYVNKADAVTDDPLDRISVPVFVYVDQKVETTNHLDDLFSVAATTTTTTDNDYTNHVYGKPTQITLSISDGVETYQTITTNTYTSVDLPNWSLGQLQRASVQSVHANSSTLTRVTEFAYDATTRLLTRETIEPSGSSSGVGTEITMTTAYRYDSYGNRTQVVVCDGSVVPSSCNSATSGARVTDTGFTSNSVDYGDGRFATSATNALGHVETRTYDARYGTATQLVGPNQGTTTWVFDELGRKLKETRQVGSAIENMTVWLTRKCDSWICTGEAAGAVYQAVALTEGQPPQVTYYDVLNRPYLTETFGFDGTPIYKHTQYDSRSRVLQVSEPYFEGDTPLYTVSTYDNLDRVQVITTPLDDIGTTSTMETDYQGFTTVQRDGKGHTTTEVKNVVGQSISVTDDQNNTLTYSYDAKGNLLTTTDSASNVITVTYDDRDRKVSMDDPDMGYWTYAYNSFGELTSQTDAKAQTTTIAYDVLGRMTSRTDLAGTGSAYTSTWTYFNDAINDPQGSIGKLKQMDGPHNSSRSFTYSAQGLLLTTTDVIDGYTFTTTNTYDSLGRLSTLAYPTGFTIKRTYNAQGFLATVQKSDDSIVYWQADEINARGQLVEQTLGNDTSTINLYNEATGWVEAIQTIDDVGSLIQHHTYIFDEVGNLTRRQDVKQSVTESFQYDSLDRLTSSTITGGPQDGSSESYVYDNLGNIIEKDGLTYSYGTGTAPDPGPHAVKQKGTTTYTYDANGNMISGAGRTITYTAFNKPTQIIDTNTSSTVDFLYGADRSRILKINASNRTAYVGLGKTGGTLYEQTTDTSTGDQKHEHFIYAMGKLVATYIDDDGTTSTQYLHHDHLGSIDAITDSAGVLVIQKSYDAFGKRRNPNWVPAAYGSLALTVGNFGFTGHEHIEEVGLIHMNGRVYDPDLGRFVSADPHIQFEKNTQSYNRYSYVSNNPLKYTDPSGYFLDKVFKEIGRFADRVKAELQRMSPELTTALSIGLSFLPGGAWIAGGFNAAVAEANGASFGQIATSFGVGFMGGQLGGAAANAAKLTQYTAAYGALQGLVSGAFTGGINAIINDTDIGEGILEGAASGAAIGAFVGAIEKDPGEKVASTKHHDIPDIEVAGNSEGQCGVNMSCVDNGLVNPSGGEMRNDDAGLGYFGASRDNNSRAHLAVDLVTTNGQNIVAPFDGTVTNFIGATTGYPMADIVPSDLYTRLSIDKVRILYVNAPKNTQLNIGREVLSGEIIGTATNLQNLGYPGKVTPHVHVQVQTGGKWVDPASYFLKNQSRLN